MSNWICNQNVYKQQTLLSQYQSSSFTQEFTQILMQLKWLRPFEFIRLKQFAVSKCQPVKLIVLH